MSSKVEWEGSVTSVQPRIRLTRSFDQRQHSYLGYVLEVDGAANDEGKLFRVGLGKAANAKHGLRVGDRVKGKAEPVSDPRFDAVDYYKVSGLAVLGNAEDILRDPPPWQGIAPALEVYRERGHRRLAARTYDSKCRACLWGCRMAVEMIIDQWNPSQKRYRFETFCYGPKSCKVYRAGPTRKVPGRRGMSYEEEDWVDEDSTSHRGPDD